MGFGEKFVLFHTTDFADERYAVGSELGFLKQDGSKPIIVKVASHRKHKNFDLLTFEGYTLLNDVEAFRDGCFKSIGKISC